MWVISLRERTGSDTRTSTEVTTFPPKSVRIEAQHAGEVLAGVKFLSTPGSKVPGLKVPGYNLMLAGGWDTDTLENLFCGRQFGSVSRGAL